MNFNDRKSLEAEGFEGFYSVKQLMDGGCADIPQVAGVYLVLNPTRKKSFRPNNVGGWRKRKKLENPTVCIDELNANWVEGTIVLYIGQTKQKLRKRVQQYVVPVRKKITNPSTNPRTFHWGGRYIWQLKNYSELQICCKPLPDGNPSKVEKDLIQEFKSQYNGQRPFANLKD